MQCSAKSKRTGKRCGHGAVPGAQVCKWHGGAAPQVQNAARLRVAALVDPAIGKLERILHAKDTPPSVLLGAIRDVLDRNGLKPQNERTLDTVGETLETLLAVYNRVPERKAKK